MCQNEVKVCSILPGRWYSGGNKEDVIHDNKNIEVKENVLGLMLNRKKTELICNDPTFRGFVLGSFPGV